MYALYLHELYFNLKSRRKKRKFIKKKKKFKVGKVASLYTYPFTCPCPSPQDPPPPPLSPPPPLPGRRNPSLVLPVSYQPQAPVHLHLAPRWLPLYAGPHTTADINISRHHGNRPMSMDSGSFLRGGFSMGKCGGWVVNMWTCIHVYIYSAHASVY